MYDFYSYTRWKLIQFSRIQLIDGACEQKSEFNENKIDLPTLLNKQSNFTYFILKTNKKIFWNWKQEKIQWYINLNSRIKMLNLKETYKKCTQKSNENFKKEGGKKQQKAKCWIEYSQK